MATTAVDHVFVDTNVVVFASVPAAPLHAVALQKMQDLKQAGTELWFSRQIVREFLDGDSAADVSSATFQRCCGRGSSQVVGTVCACGGWTVCDVAFADALSNGSDGRQANPRRQHRRHHA